LNDSGREQESRRGLNYDAATASATLASSTAPGAILMRPNRTFALFVAIVVQLAQVAGGGEVVLEQIISREHPQFDPAAAMMTAGGDGSVYLGSIGPENTAYVLRASPDGKSLFGGSVTYALNGIAVNRDGVLATANGHFAHKIALYDKQFKQFAEASDFRVGDDVGYDAPSHVEAGESGDFYALDKHRDRIVRLSAQGKVITAYPVPREPAGNAGMVDHFRVCEKLERFYLTPRQGPLRVIDFAGKTLWTSPHRASVSHVGLQGGYDVDDDGNLYVIQPRSSSLVKLDAAGMKVNELAIDIPGFSPSQQTHDGTISGLELFGDELLLKRRDATKLFERYDLTTGAHKGTVASQHERLTVKYPSDLWTAGESIDFQVDFGSADPQASPPQGRIWLRPLHRADYWELKLTDGKVQVPADLAGIYQLKVTPEVWPEERAGESEYLVRGWVEIRSPGAKGSLSVFTPQNRSMYASGEEIPLTVLARSAESAPLSVRVTLTSGDQELASSEATAIPGTVLPIGLSASVTKALGPGKYQAVTSAPGLTSVVCTFQIGPGIEGPAFWRMRYGDYGATYPSSSIWNAADVVAAHAERERKLGFNLFVDRIGTHTQIGALQWESASKAKLDELVKRLTADAVAVAPQTVEAVSPLQQVMAAYSAHGMRQMAILLYMDAGLPLGGPGFEHRKPEKMIEDLQTVTQTLLPYPAFRGWAWHANWWIYNQRGSAAAKSPDEKAAYEAALKKAKETGEWSTVLDEVSERRLGYAVEAQDFFADGLRKVAPENRLVTASAGTYRNVESYPPISFRNVDEVDLQGQFEQIFLPYFPVHAVDFYRRPGKPVWGHPEIWNDSGTGEQILPEIFSMLMRSPDGLGASGTVPPWTGKAGILEDPRNAHFGSASVFRAMNGVLQRYGHWISTLESDDHVAVVASGRQFKIDEWKHVTGLHFSRLMEAYVGCLHAHHPATIVFAEDVQPETLSKYKAVLVVDQWVELEPTLKIALQNAQQNGTRVLYDGTCRESLMQGFTPLGFAFDTFEKDKHPASDDSAYYRFPQYVRQNLPVLQRALDEAVQPAAKVLNPEVWISQLKSAEGRYLFVVNNSSVPLEPSQMWRTNLHVASLLPVVEPIELSGEAPVVYDVFALRRVSPENNILKADLRSLPARLYAILPSAIESVSLQGPAHLAAGQTFQWKAQVLDAAGRPIAASVPLQVRLLSADGRVIGEQYLAADSAGGVGDFTAPVDRGGSQLTLEATELFSGRSSKLNIEVQRRSLPFDLAAPKLEAKVAVADSTGNTAPSSLSATERDFGPHVRDIAVSADGKTALLNTMTWDHNLYAMNTETGAVEWRNKVGHYFAFSPQAIGNGWMVQGFDYHSAEGYHLHALSHDGKTQRRFSLYGLPRRLPHRFIPGLFGDRALTASNFVSAPDGSWVASSGDLGLAVWDASGKLLWKQDRSAERRPLRLAALSPSVLLTADGMTLSAHTSATGEAIWTKTLASTGTVREMTASHDGNTVAVLSNTDGGRIFVLRDGNLLKTLITGSDDIELSRDGARVVAIDGGQLKYFTVEEGLRWTFAGEDRLRNARLSVDGSRVAVSSELGTVYVLGADGELLHERDNAALTVPAWLEGGDLLLANWMGRITRLDKGCKPIWNHVLRPAEVDVPASLTSKEPVPTSRITGWGNAASESLPLQPNLLQETKALIKFVAEGSPHIGLVRKPDGLTDGSPQPPETPWLEWGDVNWFAEASPPTYLELDTFRTQLRVTDITFVEDESRPDSWLRDAVFEYWDAAEERWVRVQSLLSDQAVHTHKFDKPVEAARFRVLIPAGFYGNLRLAELVLHGEQLGSSHPDVIAQRPVAVLFDESEEFKQIFPYHDRWSFQLQGALAGGRFLQVNANQMIAPNFFPTFGHTIPNWGFEIAENPKPGQYRWVEWSWKALTPEAKGATLQIAGLRLHAGTPSGEAHLPPHPVADSLSGDWRTVRVDLWKLLNKPTTVQTMYLGAAGGPVGFDRVLLGRTEADLDRARTSQP